MALRPCFASAPAFSPHVAVQDERKAGKRTMMPQCYATRPTGKPKKRVLCYGDSLTAGFHSYGAGFAPYGLPLAQQLAGEFDVEVFVNGLVGCTAKEFSEKSLAPQDGQTLVDMCKRTGQGLRLILSTRGPFDLVCLMAGTNDLAYFGEHEETIFPCIRRCHEICHELGVPTVALTVPPNKVLGSNREYSHDWQLVNNSLTTWAQGDGKASGVALLFDTSLSMPYNGSSQALWDADGLHFSPPGGQQLAAALAPEVASVLRGGQAAPGDVQRVLDEQTQLQAEITKLQAKFAANEGFLRSKGYAPVPSAGGPVACAAPMTPGMPAASAGAISPRMPVVAAPAIYAAAPAFAAPATYAAPLAYTPLSPRMSVRTA